MLKKYFPRLTHKEKHGSDTSTSKSSTSNAILGTSQERRVAQSGHSARLNVNSLVPASSNAPVTAVVPPVPSTASEESEASTGAPLPIGKGRNIGLTLLAEPKKPQSAIVDIVFIHGLTGNAYSTWLYRNGEQKVYWPYDLLPKVYTDARILTFGYDADITQFWGPASSNRVGNHAENLLGSLSRLREDRKIIFVVHSLGGLVAKCALNLSKSSPETDIPLIEEHTVGIAFLGTPHHGSNSAAWVTFASSMTNWLKRSNKNIVAVLEPDSEVLAGIQKGFEGLLARRRNVGKKISITCFFEELAVTSVGEIVPKHSAILAPYPYYGIRANHMNMTRFENSQSPGFETVEGEIFKWVKVLRSQGQDRQSDNHQEGQTHMGTWASKDTNASEFLAALSLLSDYLPRFPYNDAEAARRINMRELERFFDSPEFNQWSHESGLLWLSGAPKSGKTILSFCLWENLKRNRTFTNNEDVAFFFCSPTSDSRAPAENEAAQILSTIINQLLRSNWKRLGFVVQQCSIPKLPYQPTSVTSSPSYLDELWKILFVSIMTVPTCPVTLIIDGIDKLRTEEARQTFCKNLLSLQIELVSKGIRGFKIFITSKPFNDIKKALTGVLTIEKDKERQQCLQALRFDELNARRDRVELAHEKTGEWLRDDAGYIQWQSSDNSGLLLIRGKPGSGKSTLAKFILNSLNSQHGYNENNTEEIAKTKKNVLIADFFYSFRGGKTETSHRLMLQSLLYQLLSQDDRLFPLFRDTFRARRSDGHQLLWEWIDLRKIFASLESFEACEKIYILVDAMDESDEQGRPEILQLLMQLCSPKSECAIKALIATRPLPQGEIDERSSHCHLIVLQERNQKDIENVIVSGIREIKDIPDSPSIDLGFIKDYMMQNADGVFLWVALVFRELKELVLEGCSLAELEACLNSLPTELEDMYRLIIRRLFDRPKYRLKAWGKKDSKKKKGVKMLNWATFAQRPLTSREFRDAIAVPSVLEPFSLGTNFLSRNRVDGINHSIRACCGSLLEVRGSVVQLLHQTARDFLLRKDKAAAPFDMDVIRGDTEISSVCIRYLHLLSMRAESQAINEWNETDYDELVNWLADFSLLDYVISSLPSHMKSLVAGSLIYGELSSFLQILETDKVLFCLFESWTELLDGQQLRGSELDMRPIRFRTKSLIAAARNGCAEVVKLLIQLHTNINGSEEASGMFALYAAAENKHLATVRLLLENGADIDAQGGQKGTALQVASARGHGQVVKLLHENGADLNTENSYHQTPLHQASERGHLDIVQLLLDKGADINAQDGYHQTPLHRASERGYIEIVQLLGEKGAHIEDKDTHGYTPLHLASKRGHLEIFQLLLQNGADFNTVNSYHQTLLHQASERGHLDIVQLLLDKGAEVDAKDYFHRTPLYQASEGGHLKIVQSLLEKGAEVDAKDHHGHTPLHLASERGHLEIVQLLLEKGADSRKALTSMENI